MMMDPEASVSALVFHHPDCAYFTVAEPVVLGRPPHWARNPSVRIEPEQHDAGDVGLSAGLAGWTDFTRWVQNCSRVGDESEIEAFPGRRRVSVRD